MSAVQWFIGPPPAVGWWPAEYQQVRHKYPKTYRWWNGEYWSCSAEKGYSIRTATEAGMTKHACDEPISWRHWSMAIDGTDGKGAHL